MAGYDKQIVVDAVQAELDRTTDGEDRKFDQDLAKWKRSHDTLGERRARAVEAADRLVKALADGDYDEARKVGKILAGDRWEEGVLDNVKDAGEMPFRVRSSRERALQRTVDVISSADQATVSVADLRAWGVFNYVTSTSDSC